MESTLDAGPLIYLAKLDALDVLERSGRQAVVTPAVVAETARPELAFRHPEVALIQEAVQDGRIRLVPLEKVEQEAVAEFGQRISGLHAGELEVLALGRTRGWEVCFQERQALRVARAYGLTTVHVVELLFGGTPDIELLRRRIRRFAVLTDLASADLDTLVELIEERR